MKEINRLNCVSDGYHGLKMSRLVIFILVLCKHFRNLEGQQATGADISKGIPKKILGAA